MAVLPVRRWLPAVVVLGVCALLAATNRGTASSTDTHMADPCPGICGRVSAADTGEPISRFTLAIFSADRPEFPAPQFRMPAGYPVPPGPLIETLDISSADGSFAIAPPNATAVFVGASAPGYWPRESAAVRPGAGALEIKLERRGRVTMKVVDERGRPIAGAAIHHDSPGWPLAVAIDSVRRDQPFARSDQGGEVSLEEPYLAEMPLLVLSESMIPQRMTIEKGRRKTEVVLHQGIALRGVTRSSDGKAMVAAVEARCEGMEPIRALTRVDGTYYFEALPRRRCELHASRDIVDEGRSLDPIQGLATVDLSAGAPATDITIPPAGIVRGRITGLGRIEGGYMVVARNGDEIVEFPAASNGAFERRLGLAQWKIQGRFEADGTRLQTAEAAVAIKDGERRDVELPFMNRTTLRVLVNEQPLGTTIAFEPESPDVSTRVRTGPTREGLYELAGLERGRYRARFAYGLSEYETTIDVPSSASDVALQLYDGRIRILDRNGAPVHGDFRIERSEPLRSAITRVTEEGTKFSQFGNGDFRAHDLFAGTYRVAVSSDGYRDTNVEISVPGEPVDVVLETRPRPFPRPAQPSPATGEQLAVLEPVMSDLATMAREFWKVTGGTRGRLVVADETVSRPDLRHAWFEREENAEALERLERRDVMRAYTKASSVIRRLPRESRPGILMAPFDELPLLPPGMWSEATSEADLFDPGAMEQRWDKASGFVFLTAPGISADGKEAVAAASIYLGGGSLIVRLYRLVRQDGRWLVSSHIDFEFGGC